MAFAAAVERRWGCRAMKYARNAKTSFISWVLGRTFLLWLPAAIAQNGPESGSTATKDRSRTSGPAIYVSIVCQNEEPGNRRADYAANREVYLANRKLVKLLADTVIGRGATLNFQSDWNYLLAVRQFDVGNVTTNTAGKNMVRWLAEDRGVEIDPRTYETSYNYADVAWLIEQLGVKPSGIVGAFVLEPPDNPRGWEKYRAAVRGAVFPNHYWQASGLWGGATLSGPGTEEYSSGIWRPRDRSHFSVDDPAQRLIYIGRGQGKPAGIRQLLQEIDDGRAPRDGFYTAAILAVQDWMNEDNLARLGKVIDSFAPEAAAGRIRWATLSQVAQIWQNDYRAKVFRYNLPIPSPKTKRPAAAK
jgi:hypothetical protein